MAIERFLHQHILILDKNWLSLLDVINICERFVIFPVLLESFDLAVIRVISCFNVVSPRPIVLK